MKTLKLLLTSVLLLCCSIGYALEFVVDGINYSVISVLNSTAKTVAVTSSANNYSGDIVIPESVIYNDITYNVTKIGNEAFYNCSSLTSIDLPDGLTSIGNSAFSYCSSLTSIDLPDGVTSIGGSVFSNCSSLTSIDLPDGVTSIGDRAFESCSSLTSIDLPDGVTSIGSSAFYDCNRLTSIDLPAGLTSIGSSAFSGCNRLTSIDLPAGLTSIGSSAFSGCKRLTSIDLPAGLTSIGSSAFYGCRNLDRIYLLGETPFTYNSSANIKDYERAIIVPESAVETYHTAEGWCDIAKYITSSERMSQNIEVTASNSGSSVRSAIGDELVGGVVDLKIKGTINSYDIIILNQKRHMGQIAG